MLYLMVITSLYGMLGATVLWCQKFSADLERMGYKLNANDPRLSKRLRTGSTLRASTLMAWCETMLRSVNTRILK